MLFMLWKKSDLWLIGFNWLQVNLFTPCIALLRLHDIFAIPIFPAYYIILLFPCHLQPANPALDPTYSSPHICPLTLMYLQLGL